MKSLKSIKIPHTFTIVFCIIACCAALTWFIPGGEFERTAVVVNGTTRNVVVADSFHAVPHVPQTWQILTAFFSGFERTAGIIVFILMIGGAFWIMNTTKAIDVGIQSFLKKTEKLEQIAFFRWLGAPNLVIIAVMLLFSLFGAVFGMSEETIAFIVIFIPLAISMGYDSIVGVLMCFVAAHVGFAGALFNPFTIGIAQGLAGLAPFSGLGYRFLCWITLTLIAIIFTLLYAKKIKKNPQKSFMYELDEKWRTRTTQSEQPESKKSSPATWITYGVISIVLLYTSFAHPFTEIAIGNAHYSLLIFPVVAFCFLLLGFFACKKSAQHFILNILLLTITLLIIGVLGYHWYIMEIAGLFLAMGISAGLAYSHSFDHIIRLFLEGCKDIMTAALVVGLAGGIIIILEDGKIIDTILYGISQAMAGSHQTGSLSAMYLIQNMLNIIIPSGSAKAALTIPMMAEFSDLIGLSRQLTVLAFQFGDGFTNMITPTSGVLIGVLGVAGIPYAKWFKFILPFILLLIVVGFFLLLPPLFFPCSGF